MRQVSLGLMSFAVLCGCTSEIEPVGTADLVDAHIESIVGNIRPTLVIEGDPVSTMTLAERMTHYEVPGVSIAVIHDGEIEWARGYGLADVENNKSVTADTMFQAGSVSKPVAALSALLLSQEGQVDLDEGVNAKLTSWQVPRHDWAETRPVTLRNLLSHTAGMTVHGFPGYARHESKPSTVEVLAGKGNTDPIRVDLEPATEWRYSGGGYTVMQLLVSDVAGKPFADVMRSNVLHPMGLVNSTYEQPLPESLYHRAATGYRSDGSRVEGDWHVYPEMAAAGLWTTPSDLARYILAIQHARAGRGDSLLDQETVDDMLTSVIGDHGLGPGINQEHGRFGHGGVNAGFECRFTAFYDEHEGVVVMTNSNNGMSLANEIVLTVATEYGWPGFEPVQKAVFEMDGDALAEFTGSYLIEGYGVIEISVQGRGLSWEGPDGQQGEILPESASDFFSPDDGQRTSFVQESGRVTGFRFGNITATKL